MCLVAVAFSVSERYPLIVAANRDERHARPTAPAAWWVDKPAVLGGRDLVAGGTWLGVSRHGRVAAVTNIFERGTKAAPLSRGRLVSDFLSGTSTPAEFAAALGPTLGAYGPFNLVLSSHGSLGFASNRDEPRGLSAGVHVFSNNAPGIDWPKLGTARAAVEAVVGLDDPEESLFALLGPRRGRGPGPAAPRESIFVVGTEFGTRCSTVVLAGRDGRVSFAERRFDAAAAPAGTTRVDFDVA
jgi:uncharacterized protein with NRDE domain